MKKIALSLTLISVFTVACGEKNSGNQNPNKDEHQEAQEVKEAQEAKEAQEVKEAENKSTEPTVTPAPKLIADPVIPPVKAINSVVDPKPVDSPNLDPVPMVEKESIILLGENGKITLNNETGEYNIESEIKGNFDYSKELSKASYYDSYQTDNKYVYKSELFPVDKYSYFQIPQTIYFDNDKTINGKASHGEYDVNLQFGGKIGSKFKSYYACYKSKTDGNSSLDFIIKSKDIVNNESCTLTAKRVKKGEINKVDINGDDFILMRFNEFKFYSYGSCDDIAVCKIFHKFKLNYFVQK